MAHKGKGKAVEDRKNTPSSRSVDLTKHGWYLNTDSRIRSSIEPSPSTGSNEDQQWHSVNQKNCPVRYRDAKNNLSGFRSLQHKDVILLLTPIVPPRQGTPPEHYEYDPYEYFGRALLSRLHGGKYVRRDGLGEDRGDGVQDVGDDLHETLGIQQERGAGAVAHVSYTNHNLITSTHRGFMRLAKFVIFVLNDTSEINHPHVNAANIALTINEDQFGDKRGIPLVLTNNTPGAFDMFEKCTVIQTADYSKASLDAIAGIIFGEIGARTESADPSSTS